MTFAKDSSPTDPRPFKKVNMGSENNLHHGMNGGDASTQPTFEEAYQTLERGKNAPLIPGNTCYLISRNWIDNFEKIYGALPVQARSEPIQPNTVPPIDNSDIESPIHPGELMTGLYEITNFAIVNQKSYEKLKKWFKISSVEFPKKIIMGFGHIPNPIVELYPKEFHVLTSLDNSTETVRVLASKADKVQHFVKRACESLNLDVMSDLDVVIYAGEDSEFIHTFEKVVYEPGTSIGECSKLDAPYLLIRGKDDEQPDLSRFGSTFSRPIPIHSGPIEDNDSGWGNSFSPVNSYKRISPSISPSPQDVAPGAWPRRKFNQSPERSNRIPGVTGLGNQGNTCFMNSALQCLSNTRPLTQYFLSGQYMSEINRDNPLGMGGQIAESYGELINTLWRKRANSVVPRDFKVTIGKFAPQFVGYHQHDSQELTAFLLDGLHEDLNRVKKKPYVEVPDNDGSIPEKEYAEKLWHIHKARNDSIIVDHFQGQYKSTLVCPECHHVSITFDPFMYLTVPIPFEKQKILQFMFVPLDVKKPPVFVRLRFPLDATNGQVKKIIRDKLKLSPDNDLIMFEEFSKKVYKFFGDDEEADWKAIAQNDHIIVCEVPNNPEYKRFEVVLTKKNTGYFSKTEFGSPFVISIPTDIKHANLYNILLEQLQRYTTIDLTEFRDTGDHSKNLFAIEFDKSNGSYTSSNFSSILVDEDDKVVFSPDHNKMELLLSSQYSKFAEDDNNFIKVEESLMENPVESGTVGIDQCFDEFSKEEQLGEDDAWYCPKCKKHQQATKKLELWKLPNILVVHLKRFSHSRYRREKLDNLIDFPIENLDLMPRVSSNEQHEYLNYELFAVSNHFGGLGGGHYTAFAKNQLENSWYDFDDSRVSPISQSSIVTPAAYLLFYQRKDMSQVPFEVPPLMVDGMDHNAGGFTTAFQKPMISEEKPFLRYSTSSDETLLDPEEKDKML